MLDLDMFGIHIVQDGTEIYKVSVGHTTLVAPVHTYHPKQVKTCFLVGPAW
jgi:hypothetical protein